MVTPDSSTLSKFISLEDSVLFILAAFLMMFCASRTLPLDTSQRMDSGRNNLGERRGEESRSWSQCRTPREE